MMKNKQRISVIICAFNYGKFIKKCIQSVLSQTYQVDEIIVVDDGSIDNTSEILKNFKNIIYIKQENQGKTAAFNNGFRNSSGDVIFHLDADDYWYSNKVACVMKILEDQTIYGLVHEAQYIKNSGSDDAIQDILNDKDENLNEVINFHFEDVFKYYLGDKSINHKFCSNSVVVRRNVLDSLFPLPNTLGLAIDGALLYIAAKSRLVIMSKKLSVYRLHGENYFNGPNPENRKGQIALYEWIETKMIPDDANKQSIRRLIRALYYRETSYFSLYTNKNWKNGFIASLLFVYNLLYIKPMPYWKCIGLPLKFFLKKIKA